ncbi:unnamed protein product [Prorocentrum cordatum]|uniref:Uncharacterized protein n=1 Tax=Prorocentrum cordatum TaxID=2364126 RepID=A0ABN9X0I0_9DINO|nr:unnamed protein product [Polarella glacialis]
MQFLGLRLATPHRCHSGDFRHLSSRGPGVVPFSPSRTVAVSMLTCEPLDPQVWSLSWFDCGGLQSQSGVRMRLCGSCPLRLWGQLLEQRSSVALTSTGDVHMRALGPCLQSTRTIRMGMEEE